MIKVGTTFKVIKPFNIFNVGDKGHVAEIEPENERKEAWCKVYVKHKNRSVMTYILLLNGEFKHDNVKEI